MFVLLTVATALVLHVPEPPADQPKEPPPYVFEHGSVSHLTQEDGVLRIKEGNGWLRSRRVFGDFTLTADFRLLDDATEAGIGVRTLTADGRWPKRGYHVLLSGSRGFGEIEARHVSLVPVTTTPIRAPGAGTWHSLALTGEGHRITVKIDGIVASVADIEHLAGSLLFDVRHGALEIRGLKIIGVPLANLARRIGKPEPGVEPPRLIKEVKPNYTRDAMERKVEGVLEMDVMILEDGTVGAVWLTSFLDPDLEQTGVAAVSQWRFMSATVEGKPTRVIAQIDLTFTMR
jgi:Gram-negative bacterial TonB protein C-terminal/Domain of Unknown Function (DUF1080)